MMIKFRGCDLSHWQGDINFLKLSRCIDFAILKLGGSDTNGNYYIDKKFVEYYYGCKQHNIRVGCYWFAGKKSVGAQRGIDEADYVLRHIEKLRFDYPIYLDFEVGAKKLKDLNTSFVKAFCKRLENEKYFTGVYSSEVDGFCGQLNLKELGDLSLWVARYGQKPKLNNTHMWQYTNKGRLDGIKGDVDLDYVYTDFAKIIYNKGLNHLRG